MSHHHPLIDLPLTDPVCDVDGQQDIMYYTIGIILVNYILGIIGMIIGFNAYCITHKPQLLFASCVAATGVIVPLPFIGLLGFILVLVYNS